MSRELPELAGEKLFVANQISAEQSRQKLERLRYLSKGGKAKRVLDGTYCKDWTYRSKAYEIWKRKKDRDIRK